MIIEDKLKWSSGVQAVVRVFGHHVYKDFSDESYHVTNTSGPTQNISASIDYKTYRGVETKFGTCSHRIL
jgi:hypothetical protein